MTFARFTEPTKLDPITNRKLSKACWNGDHEEDENGSFVLDCLNDGCECLCHAYDPLAERKY